MKSGDGVVFSAEVSINGLVFSAGLKWGREVKMETYEIKRHEILLFLLYSVDVVFSFVVNCWISMILVSIETVQHRLPP